MSCYREGRIGAPRFSLVPGLLLLISFLPKSLPAQTDPTSASPANNGTASAPQAAGSQSTTGAELSTHDEVTTFRVKVNEVLVRTVVRDAQGRAVGNLKKEDFELFDNKKPQTITHFAMEQPGKVADSAGVKTAEGGEASKPALAAPNHFVAYVFDDVHGEFADLVRVRDAAERHMATLTATDRAAVWTTSGQGNVDFTDDRAALHKALMSLQPRPVARATTTECPDVSYYMADQIVNKHDPTALQVATADALGCAFNSDVNKMAAAQQLADATANRVLQLGEAESRLALSVLNDVVRRITAMPGQRTVLLLSPGFLTPQLQFDYGQLIDRALRSQVIVSALNMRGLYTAETDITKAPSTGVYVPTIGAVSGNKMQYETASAFEQENILHDLAEGTGGTYFHNSNDLDAGFRQIAAAPEYWYVLGFAPQNLKLDGSFHRLKVVVKEPPKATVLARKGYYAPKHATDADEQAKQEIEDALFSQEELHDLPVELHTQFFKPSDEEAKLAVLVHIDARHLHFTKADGRNTNKLTIVSGIFDRNGRFLSANEKVLEMHLKDDTLANRLGQGITLKSNFDVKPGGYLVRLVVRDTGGQISAANGAVEIP